MAITLTIIGADVTATLHWQSLTISEQIGSPDTLTAELSGFLDEDEYTQAVRGLFADAIPDNLFYAVARRDSEILFSGAVRSLGIKRPAQGALTYSLSATGWQFLAAKRLVGVPGGSLWSISDDEVGQGDLPTPVAIDPDASAVPTAAGVRGLMDAYWLWPSIDVDSFVSDVLDEYATAEPVTWSGSDLDGALSDLAAAGSASALWWMANDSPDAGDTAAPHLALHWGVVTIPAPGDPAPDGAAPYAINDEPDWTETILATGLDLAIDYSARSGGAYVRGATGFVLDVTPSPSPPGYATGDTHEGGTGWVTGSAPGSQWGEEYVDAPAAVSTAQRDAFGNATLEAHARPAVTGTIRVAGDWHGWHKSQLLRVTDADFGLVDHWFLVRGVTMTQRSPDGAAAEYVLSVGDQLPPALGLALRAQRLREQRAVVAPAMKFVPPDPRTLTLDRGESCPVEGQLATAEGHARMVAGVGATWHLWVNGDQLADSFDAAGDAWWLSDATDTTDDLGRVFAVLHAGAAAADADAAAISIDVVLP